MENKEDAKILFDVINTLPDNQKTAFMLSKIDGMTNPEVSEIRELSISSVESLLFRAKKYTSRLGYAIKSNFYIYVPMGICYEKQLLYIRPN